MHCLYSAMQPNVSSCLQEERAEPLWKALEKVIPDIRKRAEVTLIGSPLTHEFWLRRNKGTYGAAISAQHGSFPGPQTPIKHLYRCVANPTLCRNVWL